VSSGNPLIRRSKGANLKATVFELFASVFALAAIIVASVAVARVQRLERRLAAPKAELPAAVAPQLPLPTPLAGLRIAIDVSQDNPHPIVANLLRDQLLGEDAEIVDREEADIVISGSVVCNGYAEIYYQAELTCRTQLETICAVSQKPPHGDRPANLAIELIAKLKSELESLVSRSERRRALRELRGDAP
jgi:hypothetical protein